jgi:hypothetical protein
VVAVPLPIRKFVIEWRFSPSLAVYGAMDRIGLEFSERLPDWQRTPLTLELRNAKRRHRFFISFERCFLDRFGDNDAELSGEIELANSLFRRLTEAAEVRSLRRIGMRTWAAFPQTNEFPELVRKFAARFQPANNEFSGVFGGETRDTGYMSEVQVPEGWRYRLWCGPMEKDQWFQLVPQEGSLFESPQALGAYRESIQPRLLFVDIDCFSTDVTPAQSPEWCMQAYAKARDTIHRIHEYFRRG